MGYSCYRASRCFLAHCCPANLHQMRLCVSAGGCKHPHCSSSTCRYHPIMFSESPQKHTKIQKYQNFTALKSMYCVSVLLLAPPPPSGFFAAVLSQRPDSISSQQLMCLLLELQEALMWSLIC